jgi:hypothetical protein
VDDSADFLLSAQQAPLGDAAAAETAAEEGRRRMRYLRQLAHRLKLLSDRYGLAVVCVNQMTMSMSDELFNHSCSSSLQQTSSLVPALGQTWTQQLTMRLLLERPTAAALRVDTTDSDVPVTVRQLRVLFAPHIPPRTKPLVFGVLDAGIVGLPDDDDD